MNWAMTIVVAGAMTLMAGSAANAEVLPNDVEYVDGEVVLPLLEASGDAVAGADVFASKKIGNCLACHAVSSLSDKPFHGDVGPELDGAADRWSEGQLRAIVADAKKVFGSQTVMPGFYSLEVGADVREKSIGLTILSAQQIEDLVAFLSTLTEE